MKSEKDVLDSVIHAIEMSSSTGDVVTNQGLHEAAIKLRAYRDAVEIMVGEARDWGQCPPFPDPITFQASLSDYWRRTSDAYVLNGRVEPGGVVVHGYVFWDARIDAWISTACINGVRVYQAETKSHVEACRDAGLALKRAVEIRSPVRAFGA